MARRPSGKSKALRAYQRRTKAADAVIASTYLTMNVSDDPVDLAA